MEKLKFRWRTWGSKWRKGLALAWSGKWKLSGGRIKGWWRNINVYKEDKVGKNWLLISGYRKDIAEGVVEDIKKKVEIKLRKK